MSQSIQELIDATLIKKEKRIRSHKFSPSSLGRCYRNQFWNRLNEPITNPIDARTERIFKAGDFFHNFVQELIIKNIPGASAEVLVETPDFKGYADLVLSDEVIDIKSQHSKAFWYRSKLEWKDLEPKLYCNILQVCFYAVWLRKPLEPAKKARLVFISKDDLCIQEYPIDVEGKWTQEVIKECEILQTFWKEQKLPKAQPRAYDGKECKYCLWLTKCNKIEKGEKNGNKCK